MIAFARAMKASMTAGCGVRCRRGIGEAAVVPGVGPLDDPAGSGLQREALLADHRLAAQCVEEVAGSGAVVAGVEEVGDLLGQPSAETLAGVEAAERLQGGAQRRRVVTVRWGDHAAQRDTGRVGQQGAFGALLAPVDRGSPGGLAAAGCCDQAPVDGHLTQVETDDAVIGLQAQLLKTLEEPGGNPLIAPVAQRGSRA